MTILCSFLFLTTIWCTVAWRLTADAKNDFEKNVDIALDNWGIAPGNCPIGRIQWAGEEIAKFKLFKRLVHSELDKLNIPECKDHEYRIRPRLTHLNERIISLTAKLQACRQCREDDSIAMTQEADRWRRLYKEANRRLVAAEPVPENYGEINARDST